MGTHRIFIIMIIVQVFWHNIVYNMIITMIQLLLKEEINFNSVWKVIPIIVQYKQLL